MKPLTLFLVSLSCSFSVFAQQGIKQITLEDIWQNGTFAARSVSGVVPLKDGEYYTSSVSNSAGGWIVKYEYKTGKAVDTIFRQSDLPGDGSKKTAFTGYSLSSDESKILVSTEDEPIYRHSKLSNWFVYDLKTKKTSPLSSNGKQQYPAFSPDGNKVAFVRENNLFVKDLGKNSEIPVTSDGRKNEIINGASDWVYEEEFVLTRGYEWSPDGQRIAYYRFDETNVKEYSMDIFGDTYPQKKTFKYPKAGEANSIVTICIYDAVKGSSIKVPVFKDGSVTDQYIPRIKWTCDPATLSIIRLNRAQNNLELLLANANTGQSKTILDEGNTTYINITNDLTFLDDKKHFIWSSDKDGFNHLYLYNLLTGNMEKQITSGKWDVTKLIAVDGNTVFFQSAEVSPMERYVYSVKTDGSGKKQLGSRKGTNDAEFSGTHKYFINTNSSANTPAYYSLNNASDGKEMRMIEDNSSLIKRLGEYSLTKKEFFKFKTSEGIELNGWTMKPPGFSESKKYPVLMLVYGGPGSNLVLDSWDVKYYSWCQMLCEKGYVIACVDNRGTGSRGEDFRKCTYKNLGKLETQDQVEAAKYLGSLSYIDKARIGIWGWSYGGYMATLCLSEGADVFKAGIAVAPVATWKNYDTVYGERFMLTPKQNQEGYQESSVLTHLHKMKGKFLLIHGTADDNVHFQNSMEIANELIKAGKQFDSFYYPNKSHSISGENTRLHLYTKMTDFILGNL